MRAEIRRICKEFGLTAIYVTHDQKEALSMADRMAILDGGRIAQIGAPEEIYRHPHTATVAGFIGETNLIPGTVAANADPSACEIDTSLGPFIGHPGHRDWRPAPGERVLLSIRPECLSLTDAKPARNAAAGRLVESVYLGETAHYSLQTGADPDILHIAELNPRRVIREEGATWHATADPQDIVIVPAV